MAQAKAIDLRVRPLQSVDLCFQVDGVIGDQPELHLLGKAVPAFDLPAFFAMLGQTKPPGPGGASRLKFDSAAIRSQLAPSILYELRADAMKADLDKAIAQRENMFLQKFSDRVNVIAALKAASIAKENSLKSLIQSAADQHNFLQAQYAADFTGATFPNGVVKKTQADTTNNSHPVTVKTTQGSGTTPSQQTSEQSSADLSTNLQSTSTTLTRGYDYRHPKLENDAQFFRSQVSLGDEQLAQFLSSRNRNFLDTVFDNDLAAMDLDVRKLQLAYASTILVSPITGVVTGVFRNKGDWVRAGQPVVRVENNSEVLLVGTIKFRGLVSVGSAATVKTEEFDAAPDLSIPGTVVAIRGHDSENEQWDVIIQANNSSGLPINYNFDFDVTTIDFS